MTAHVRVLGYGPSCAVICDRCDLRQQYDRWKPARAAALRHNLDVHPERGRYLLEEKWL